MECFLLFIRERGQPDVIDFHPDRRTARSTLASYVRAQPNSDGRPHAEDDDTAIADYFAGRNAIYTVARVKPRQQS